MQGNLNFNINWTDGHSNGLRQSVRLC